MTIASSIPSHYIATYGAVSYRPVSAESDDRLDQRLPGRRSVTAMSARECGVILHTSELFRGHSGASSSRLRPAAEDVGTACVSPSFTRSGWSTTCWRWQEVRSHAERRLANCPGECVPAVWFIAV